MPPPIPLSQPLRGIRLYSPGTLAAFTALGSLPIGFVLYGLNVRARGHSALGRSMVAFGVALQLLIVITSATGLMPARPFLVLGIFGALNVYRFESGPYERAVRLGATRAPWWPAALIVAAVSAALFILSVILSVVL